MYITGLEVKNNVLRLSSVLISHYITNVLICTSNCMQLQQLYIEVSYMQLHMMGFMVYTIECQGCLHLKA